MANRLRQAPGSAITVDHHDLDIGPDEDLVAAGYLLEESDPSPRYRLDRRSNFDDVVDACAAAILQCQSPHGEGERLPIIASGKRIVPQVGKP